MNRLPTSAPTWPPPNGQPILTFPQWATHPNLPKGKEQITPHTDFSPHLSSPVG